MPGDRSYDREAEQRPSARRVYYNRDHPAMMLLFGELNERVFRIQVRYQPVSGGFVPGLGAGRIVKYVPSHP